MFSYNKLTNISIWGFIQRFLLGFLILSEDDKDVADVALDTENCHRFLEKKNPEIWTPGIILDFS